MSIKPRACRRRGCGGCPRCEPDGCEASRGWHGHQPAGVYRPACEGRRTPLRGGVCAFVGGASSYVCPWSPWGAACGGGWPVRWRWVQAGALTWAPASPKLREAARLHRLAECVGQGEHTWPSANYAPFCMTSGCWRMTRVSPTRCVCRRCGAEAFGTSPDAPDGFTYESAAQHDARRDAAIADVLGESRPRGLPPQRPGRSRIAALALLAAALGAPAGAIEVHPDPKRRRR